MQNKPYYCPNCRSNRVRFSVISSYSQRFLKDAVSGEIQELNDPQQLESDEPVIQCLVCQFAGNEMRFIKQAEREPRTATSTQPASM